MKIQLAIQGGGAKLITLLGAASAIQERDRIELTRIVGTSAGAIVGALLAAKVDINAFRDQLTNGLGARIRASFKKPTSLKWGWTVVSGQPLWQNTVLNEILTEVFKRHNLKKLSDIKAATGIDLRVVCADLRSADPVVYKPNGNDKDIVTALMDSAGIPIYFRTWRDGSYVDGGVVQNFPWEELIDTGGASKGPILGLSFASEARDIANTRLGYAGALLNTALDSATERARAHLGADRVLTLPNRFGTFDFKEAFSSASLKDHFDSAKWETGNWLDSRLRDSAVLVTDDPWRHQHLFDGEDR